MTDAHVPDGDHTSQTSSGDGASQPSSGDGASQPSSGDGASQSRFNISTWAIKHQAVVLFAILALLVSGVTAFNTLGRSEDPSFIIRTMIVTTTWPGATAREMELHVTDELEKVLQQIPWFDNVTSYSRPGEATLMVTVRQQAPAEDVNDAWYQVRKRLTDHKSQLPQGVQGPFFNDEFGDTFGTIYAFSGEGFSFAEMKDIVEGVRQRVLRVKDVAKADLVGVQAERFFVEFSHRRLATLGISAGQVLDALRQQTSVVASGTVEIPTERIAVRIEGEAGSETALAELPLSVSGRSLRIGDVATVTRGYEDPATSTMRFNGKPVIGLAISMAEGGNMLTLGKALTAEMAAIERDLPAGVIVEQVADQPHVVDDSISEFVQALTEALVIVLGVGFVSLGLRTGAVVALSVPLVLAITFVIMQIAGIDLHRISLGALIIALGLLVDDAIIAVEMMAVKLEQGYGRLAAASHAYTITAFPMLTGTLVTAAGFIPVGFAKSNAGEYTGTIFWVVGIALLVSWVTAVVFTPYIGYHLLPQKKAETAHDIYDTRLYRRFRRVLGWVLDHRKIVIGATAAAFVAAMAAFSLVPQQFFPSSTRPELIVTLRLPGGSSFAATEAAAARLEDALTGDPDVEHYAVYTGAGSPRFYLSMKVELRDPTVAEAIVMTRGGEARDRVQARMQNLLDTQWTDLSGRVARLENGPPVGYPVQFRILGSDPMELRRIASQVRSVFEDNPHTRDVNYDWYEMAKRVTLTVDRARARAIGVTPQQLAEPLNSLLSGTTVAEIRDGNEIIPVVARAVAEERKNLDDLSGINVTVTDESGNPRAVSLDQLATLDYAFEEPVIWRRNRQAMLTVRAEIADATQPPVVTAQIDAALDSIRAKLPDGYRIEVAGVAEESAPAQASIAAGVPVMILVMLTVLMVQLQDFRRLGLVVLTAPLGMIGVTLALLVFRQPFGFVATLGVIALAGMIMRNTVILVEQIDRGLDSGEDTRTAIIEATVHRARPVLLTAAAAILAMIPLTRSIFWAPMAVAIMGGLAVATILTLLVVPALYALWLKPRNGAAQPAI